MDRYVYCVHNKPMRYGHDPKKLAGNVAKHGVWFAEADGFEWASALITSDSRRNYGEARLVAIGYIGLKLYVMVFTLRENAVRIISLRRANRREERQYAET